MTLKFTKTTATGTLIASLAMTQVALANVDEIVVTAAKREQTLQEVPIAVTVTSGETIEQAQIVDLLDLQTVVPSLRISQLQSSANTNFIIRGFGNGANNPGIEPSVAVYIDGVYRSRSGASLADLPTVERVEVLRGPQSTLFGKNASAGVISITTALPDDEFNGMVEANFGNYGNTILKGTVSGPLSDSTAFRLTGSVNENDGYYTNITNGEKLNERNRMQIRAQFLSELTDSTTLRVIADYNSTDEKCCGASMLQSGAATAGLNMIGAAFRTPLGLSTPTPPVGDDVREIALSRNPTNELEGKGISAQFDVDMDGMQFVSITSYREQVVNSETDGDFNIADALGRNEILDKFETFTQELRLSSDNDSDLQWMVGGYYFDEDVKHFRDVIYGPAMNPYVNALLAGATQNTTNITGLASTLTLIGAGIAPGATGIADTATVNAVPALQAARDALAGTWYQTGQGLQGEYFTMQNEAISLFGTLDYNISDDLTVSVGLNYTEDEKTVIADVDIDDPFGALPLAAVNPALAALQFFPPFVNYPNANESGVFKSDDLTHSLRFTYELDDSTSIYVSHSTGFKATSVNMSVDARTIRSAKPEEAQNIEIGLKKTLDNGFVNVALFEQEIDGFQSNLFTGTGFALINAGLQVHTGAEIDAAFALSENLTVTASATYIDPEYETYNALPDLTGQAPAGVSELSANLGAVYAYEMGADKEAYFRVEYLYEDDVQVVDNVAASVASREVSLVNASYGVENTKYGWEIRAWVRNLTDDEFLISAFPTTAQQGSFSGYVSAPRTYGIAIRQNF
ncbi:MAG: TonB-dependent receptor [Parvibaculales bacterium]